MPKQDLQACTNSSNRATNYSGMKRLVSHAPTLAARRVLARGFAQGRGLVQGGPHLLVQGVQHQGHAHKRIGRVGCQVIPELADAAVYLSSSEND